MDVQKAGSDETAAIIGDMIKRRCVEAGAEDAMALDTVKVCLDRMYMHYDSWKEVDFNGKTEKDSE